MIKQPRWISRLVRLRISLYLSGKGLECRTRWLSLMKRNCPFLVSSPRSAASLQDEGYRCRTEWCKFVRYGQHRSYLEVEWVMKTNYYPLPYFFSILRPNQPHLLEARWRSWTGGGLPRKTIRLIPLRGSCLRKHNCSPFICCLNRGAHEPLLFHVFNSILTKIRNIQCKWIYIKKPYIQLL